MNTALIKQKYICNKHLYVSKEENSVILLGYKLNLTKTEYLIIKALAQDSSSPLSAQQIASLTELEISKENIAFHISNINKKAKCISNRLLIKNITKLGYFLYDKM